MKKPSRSLGLDHTSREPAHPPSQPALGPTPNPEFETWCLPAPQWELCPPPARMVAKNPGSEAPPHLNIQAAAGCWFLEREKAEREGPIRTVRSRPVPPRLSPALAAEAAPGGGSDQPCEDRRPRKPQLLLLLHGGGWGEEDPGALPWAGRGGGTSSGSVCGWLQSLLSCVPRRRPETCGNLWQGPCAGRGSAGPRSGGGVRWPLRGHP